MGQRRWVLNFKKFQRPHIIVVNRENIPGAVVGPTNNQSFDQIDEIVGGPCKRGATVFTILHSRFVL